MQIKTITLIVLGTKGEFKKGVFDIEGNHISGDPDMYAFIDRAVHEHEAEADKEDETDEEAFDRMEAEYRSEE
jgi:hypothetical protein